MFFQNSAAIGTTTTGGHPQGNGAFVFAENLAKTFQVQVCHTPFNDQVSGNSAAAVKFKLANGEFAVLKNVGGSWTGVPAGVSCSATTCTFPDGEVVSRSGGSVFVRLPSKYCGAVQGMCGRYQPTTNFADAYSASSGEVIDVSAASGQTYNWGGPFWGKYQSQFVESYKATGATSLFSASECSNTPTVMPSVIKEPFADCPGLMADAVRECPDGARYNDCLMDVGATCNLEKWVKDAETAGPPADFATPPPTPKPTPAAPPAPTPAPCAFDSCSAMSTCGSSMRCSSSGDPHNTMFSGKMSHPQGSGPFILAQSADKAFVVQTCHQAIGSGSVSINKALAIKTPQGVIKYTDGNWDVGSTGVSCTGGVCTFAGGEKVAAVGSSVWVEFPSSYCSKVSGLCGTFNPSANFADAYTNANGLITSVNGNPQWGTFQSDFVESFALDGTSSLFTASECPLPNPNNPPPMPLVPFAACPLLKAVAEAKCPRNSRYQYCIEDVGASCDLSWVTDAQVTVPGNMGGRPTPPPTPASLRCSKGHFYNGSSCQTCAPGQFQAVEGQHGCNLCAAGSFATEGSEGCTTHTKCVVPTSANGSGEYETKSAHAHHNRECAPLTVCGDFSYISQQHTATDNRQCQPCDAGYKANDDHDACYLYSCSHMKCKHVVHTCSKFNTDIHLRAPNMDSPALTVRRNFNALRTNRDISNECTGSQQYQTIVTKHHKLDSTCTKAVGHFCGMGAASSDKSKCECIPLSIAPATASKGLATNAENGWTHHNDALNLRHPDDTTSNGLAPAGTKTRPVPVPVKYAGSKATSATNWAAAAWKGN
jgi:hypothetical protein